MRFAVVCQIDSGIKQVVEFKDRSPRRSNLGAKLGRPSPLM